MCLYLGLQTVILRIVLLYEMIGLYVQLIKFSPERLSDFDGLRMDLAISSGEVANPSLRTLCPARWTERHASINSVLLNYKILLDALGEVQKGVMSMLQSKGHSFTNGNIVLV